MRLMTTIFALAFSHSLVAVEVYKNDASGAAISGDINILKKAAEDGKVIRVMRDLPTTTPTSLTTNGMTTIYNNGSLVCLLTETNLSTIGDTPNNFTTNPNHVFANVCSDGQVHVRSGATYYNSSANMTWYVEN